MKKRRIKIVPVVILLVVMILLVILVFLFNKPNKMTDLVSQTKEYAQKYAIDNKLNLDIKEEYNEYVENGKVINQSIDKGHNIDSGDTLIITISLGRLSADVYKELSVNELGRIPVMMYHGIYNKMDSETKYTGGNIDSDGYQRTSESFRRDLEFYYSNGYRMIRLNDYVNDIIDVELGKSPIVLTFDDGIANNILVTGLDENGEIIIDPNSAVGILEEFKKRYPDFNVTATFFVNGGLFNQPKYNEKIIKWLVNNGYDVGNHSYNHADFSKITSEQSEIEIGRIYEKLESIIGDKYVSIVALPFGSPYKIDNPNFSHILNSTYNNKNYTTISTLRVGWESDYSPYSKSFNPLFIKRIRAYDNNGEEFDIEANFKTLTTRRYVSDGNKNTIVVKEKEINDIKDNNTKQVISY